ncbi:hypothetical protein ASPSYDRAFT_51465 [Aspergillus sydowii CBS 593.65]|uniref:Uncharacterized protein n=1 Tax=Aspergillus sydowii CBS 593.65 TaxID=1036612 RepID=A0A1L9T001_9EURO|nr:uncharacterized protein ASPSYDRAFT_51465 [Aspergillus sydowii CBS 593.65]OJJ52784.1 hypothetical protein ASPSYDRAFT_51465 [Aspergillus sydowii CBS 593.65]
MATISPSLTKSSKGLNPPIASTRIASSPVRHGLELGRRHELLGCLLSGKRVSRCCSAFRAEISGCDGGDLPIAYLGQHGIRDSVLGIDLGRTLRDHYVGVNGCDPATPEEPAPGSGVQQSRITRIAPQGTLTSGLRLTAIIYRILQRRVLPTRLPVVSCGNFSLSSNQAPKWVPQRVGLGCGGLPCSRIILSTCDVNTGMTPTVSDLVSA